MAQELRQDLRLTQQLIMTPQLQLAIKLLQLSRLELVDAMREEVQKNPLLELEDIKKETTSQKTSESEPVGEPIKSGSEALSEEAVKSGESDDGKSSEIDKNIELYDYLNNYNENSVQNRYNDKEREDVSFETFLPQKTTLNDHLLWQLKLTKFSAEEEKVGTFIIGNIDEDGYLKITIPEIANALGVEEGLAEKVLGRIQEFDPVGVGSRDLKECLLAQLKVLPTCTPILEEIVQNHMECLENKDFHCLSKALKIPFDDVIHAVKVITSLDPRPGRAYSVEDIHYIVPDVYVYKRGDEFVILLNDDGMPKLRVSNYYRNMLKGGGNNVDKDAKDYLSDKLKSALWFIKSIHQRQRTLYKVAESIVNFQRDFLDKGINFLKPLVLRDVAEVVGVHESTVSRVTANKFAHTPQGIFELKFFFNKGFERGGDSIAAEAVKDQIKRIIASEDPSKPYTDQVLVRMMRKLDINIARRTIAKYRESMGIAPSSKRKKVY